VVELLSPGTEDEDLGETEQKENKPPTKWDVYEKILQVPYYVVFSRYTNELKAYHLVGTHYEAMDFSSDGRLDMPTLGLSLGLWEGRFQGIDKLWLRWFTQEGDLILSPEEREELAKQEAQAAKQETEAAKQETEAAKQETESAKQEAEAAKQKAESSEREAVEAKIRAEKLAEQLRQLGINPDQT
jgi:pyruvate/2-oxoglutarate dehydrogenase complex dihydrolipoamide acyltransferase (E2) component